MQFNLERGYAERKGDQLPTYPGAQKRLRDSHIKFEFQARVE